MFRLFGINICPYEAAKHATYQNDFKAANTPFILHHKTLQMTLQVSGKQFAVALWNIPSLKIPIRRFVFRSEARKTCEMQIDGA